MAITKVTRTLLSTGIVDNSNATAITIDSSENVGIGTSSPTSALDVTGTATMDGLTVDGSAGFGVTAPSISEGYQIHTDTVGNGVWGGFGNVYLTSNYKFNSTNKFAGTGYAQLLEAVPSSGAFTFKTSSASGTADATATMQNRLNIATTGDISFYDDTGTSQALFWDASAERLGIGTTSPSANLHIGNTGGAAELWLQRTDGYNAVKLYGSTLGDGQGFKINVNNGDRFAIDSSGNVGIGTDSPSGVLHLRDTTPHLYIQSDDGQSSKLLFGDAADNSRGGFEYTSSDAMIFMTNNLSEKMRIDSSGRVGIGTDSPNRSLHVIGQIAIEDAVSTSAALLISLDSSSNKIYSRTANGVTSAHPLDFIQNSSVAMRINSSGNVGIGTDSPETQLHISGTANNTYIRIDDGSEFTNIGVDATGSFYNTNTNHRFLTASGGTEALRITDTGNVGIGTTIFTNSYKTYIEGLDQDTANLTDSGNHGATLYLRATANAAGSGGAVAFGTTFGNKTPFAAIKGHVQDGSTNTTGDLCFSTRASVSATALTERMRLTSAGNVGIGTTNALQPLTVSGSVWASGYYITNLQGNAQLTNASTSSGSNPSYIGQGLITVTISDAKAKENFGSVETNECLNKIVSLAGHVKKFDWIDEDWKKEKGRTVGMVAQEIYEDHSEFVHKPKNYDDDGWAIRYQEIVPTLTKAIQEQQTQIEALQSEINLLKGE